MKKLLPTIYFLSLVIVLFACQSDAPPASAEDARELLVGKKWAVRDAGILESSFRQNKGEPFQHTIQWFSASPDLSAENQAIRDRFTKATLLLEGNSNKANSQGDIAHFDGLNLGAQQSYYFTSTQEESAYDRTIKLYVNVIDSVGNPMQYPFVILQANSNKVMLAAPPELQVRNLVLALEAQ
jgi:CRISPR/Cas system-associated endonuclease/helicase Cas3